MLTARIETIKFRDRSLRLNATLEGGSGLIHIKGSNGSGKTSLLEAIAGIRDFVGYSKIAGFDLAESPIQYKQRLGYVPAKFDFFEGLTGLEYLSFIVQAQGVNNDRLTGFVQRLMPVEHARKKLREMSYGTVKKLLLLSGTIHDPNVVLLDEPLNGLDAKAKDYLQQYMNSNIGRKLFITVSHEVFWSDQHVTSEVALDSMP
jgi:ABC-type multidrug transport system ATPase subunit